MKKEHIIKRALAMALACATVLGVTPLLPAQIAEAADFSLGSGFTDPTITVATMYYWKEGKPPIVQNRDGKTEGSTIGAEYPVYITWGGANCTQYYFNPSVTEIENGKNVRAHDNPANVSKDCYDATVNVDNNDKWPNGSVPGFYVQWRDYTSSVGIFENLDIKQSLTQNGVAASMDVGTNLYMVPADGSHYAFELGKGTNKWIVGELHYDQRKRGGAGYENSLDWYLNTRDYDKNTWLSESATVPVRESTHNKVDGYDGYEKFDLRHRTWTISQADNGGFSIGTDGTCSWYVEDWTSSGLNDWRKRTKEWVNGKIWDWTEMWLSHEYHFGKTACLETWGGYCGDWSHAQANNDGRYKFRVFYGEPNLVSFIQTDTKVQSGQVVNLDGPIVIGQNATITVENGGVLVVSGWVMNGGFIMVKPGGMLIVQDQERLDGTKQYGVINCYQETPNKKYGRISCDGIMIVNRDCKVFGAGMYGLQFGAGAQCVNYGQLVSENFEVYGDHTIENRGDVSAVYAGWGLTGGGYAMANQKMSMGSSFKGQGNIEKTCAVKLAKDAVYGPGAGRVYVNTASRVTRQTGMANRTGCVTDVEPFSVTYTPKLDSADGVYYVTDSQSYRYDWYDSLNKFARFEYVDGTLKRYDFGGRYVYQNNAPAATRAGSVANYDAAKNCFYLKDNSGVTYWYDPAKGGFLSDDALTDVYYPGAARFPKGVKGATVSRTGNVSEASLVDGGVYFLESCLQTDKLIDVAGYSQDDGGGVHLWTKHGGANQQWKLQFAGSEKQGGKTVNYYKFISVNSGKALSIDGTTYAAGTRVAQYTARDNGDHQKWRLIQSGDGFIIVPKSNEKVCLDVSGGSSEDGALIQLWNVGNNKLNQRWRLIQTVASDVGGAGETPNAEELKEGVKYRIVPASKPELEIDPTDNYAESIDLTDNSNAKQGFVLELANRVTYGGEPRDYYYIKVNPDDWHHYMLGLDPNDFSFDMNTDVNLFRKDQYIGIGLEGEANKWYLAPAGDGSYYLQPVAIGGDDYGLGVKYGYAPSAGIELAIRRGDERIKWNFVEEEAAAPEEPEEPEEEELVFEEFQEGVRYNIVPAKNTSVRIEPRSAVFGSTKLVKHDDNNKQWFVIEKADTGTIGGQPVTYYYLKVEPSGSAIGAEMLGIDPDDTLIDVYNSDIGVYRSDEYDDEGDKTYANQWILTPAGNGTYYITARLLVNNLSLDEYGLGVKNYGGRPSEGDRLRNDKRDDRVKWAFVEESALASLQPKEAEKVIDEVFEEGVRYSIVPKDKENLRIDPTDNYAEKISLTDNSNAKQGFVLELANRVTYGGEPRDYYYIKVDPDDWHHYMLGLDPNDISFDTNTDVNLFRKDQYIGIGLEGEANKWYLAPAGDGSYYLQPVAIGGDDYGLGVKYGDPPSAGLKLAINKGDQRVKWVFEKE